MAPLVSSLEAYGWSVWWDREIRPGATWDEAIEREVRGAECVVAVWTDRSIESRWARNEAMSGLEREVLVSVLLDDVQLPIVFKGAQAATLTSWQGEPRSAQLTY